MKGLTEASELIQLNDCICPGEEVLFECTVCGGATLATVWTGNLFECAGNYITLRHSQYEYGSTASECNSGPGAVIARSIGVLQINGSRCYSSQLTVTINIEMNNKTVTCLYVNITTEAVVDTLKINITTGIIIIIISSDRTCTHDFLFNVQNRFLILEFTLLILIPHNLHSVGIRAS